MAYQATWLNQLAQYNTTEYEILLIDDAGILPRVRSYIVFNRPKVQVTQNFLNTAASLFITRVLAQQASDSADAALNAGAKTRLANLIANQLANMQQALLARAPDQYTNLINARFDRVSNILLGNTE